MRVSHSYSKAARIQYRYSRSVADVEGANPSVSALVPSGTESEGFGYAIEEMTFKKIMDKLCSSSEDTLRNFQLGDSSRGMIIRRFSKKNLMSATGDLDYDICYVDFRLVSGPRSTIHLCARHCLSPD
jgi:hypothetical protein